MTLKIGSKIESIHKIIIVLFLFSSLSVVAQKDNILWSSFQLQKSVTGNTTFNLKPIFRFNEDISNYQNMSVDYAVKQKLKKGWAVQLLGRTWFLPSSPNRQFIWVDIANTQNFNKIKMVNRLRYHWALDINDRSDPDYFRWITQFSFNNSSKITPYFGIEPWIRTNSQNQFQRIRFEPGIIWTLNPTISMNLQYRYEESINLDPLQNTNFIVFNLLYKL